MPRPPFDRWLSLGVLALAIGALVTTAAGAANYKLTDLGVIGSVGDQNGGAITGINNHGAVVPTTPRPHTFASPTPCP